MIRCSYPDRAKRRLYVYILPNGRYFLSLNPDAKERTVEKTQVVQTKKEEKQAELNQIQTDLKNMRSIPYGPRPVRSFLQRFIAR